MPCHGRFGPGATPPTFLSLLAGEVIVKTNHGCAMNIFVASGDPNRGLIIAKARHWLRKRYGRRDGEWAYWPIVPTVFVEERLALSGARIATDIKVHVCGGVVTHAWVEDKAAGRSLLFDREANPLPGRDPDYPRDDQAVPVNARLLNYVRQAVSIVPAIAGNLDYIRIDFLIQLSLRRRDRRLSRRWLWHHHQSGLRRRNRATLAARSVALFAAAAQRPGALLCQRAARHMRGRRRQSLTSSSRPLPRTGSKIAPTPRGKKFEPRREPFLSGPH